MTSRRAVPGYVKPDRIAGKPRGPQENMGSKIVRFGVFTLDPGKSELTKRGTPVRLQEQSFRMLCLLLERPNELVTREELRAHLWPDTYVDFDLALNTAVRKIRRALGDSAETPRFIETLPRRGYRFIAPVIGPVVANDEEVVADPAGAPAEPVLQPAPAPKHFPGLTARRQAWLAGGLMAAGVAAIGLWAANGHTIGGTPTRIGSIAVLPFVNLTGDTMMEYLGDGLAETLIDRLSQLRSLRVMAPGTTSSFKGREVDPRAAGRELKVAAVIQGKIYRRGDVLTVDADLVDAGSGAEVWRGRYRRQTADALDLEEEISADLTRKLRESLAEAPASAQERARFAHRSTANKEAYRNYLQGLYEMRQLSSDSADEAVRHFEQAIRLDPAYALPYFGLASTYEVLDDWVLPPQEVIPKARVAIEKALDLDPSMSEAHTMLGTVHFWYDFDQPAAEKEFQRAIELNPNFDDAHDFYGWFLVAHKRFDQGIAEHRRALELSPFDLQHHLILAQSLYYSRRYDEAMDELRTTLLQNPNAWWGHELLGWVYEQKGDIPRSAAELKRAVELEHNIAEPLASLGRADAIMGDRPAAVKILQQLQRLAAHSHVAPYALALVYAGLQQNQQTISEMRRAYEDHSWTVNFFGVDPKLEQVRADPRVQEILRQAGLP
jgi:TolB-like protein/DNA-binding winged helix-turn-helix (wHTH) protein/Tfp pilus assembly protein PilF